MDIKEQIFKLTFRRYDGYEGFLASYFLSVFIIISLFVEKSINNEAIEVLFFILVQISIISFVVSLIYIIFSKLDDKKVLTNFQFISWFNTSALSAIYFIFVLINYNFSDFNLSQWLIFIVSLFYLLRSLSIVVYYIIFWMEYNNKSSAYNDPLKKSFFSSEHLKYVRKATFIEKNVIILLMIFVLANYYYFSKDSSYNLMYETFIGSFMLYNLVGFIRNKKFKS